MLRTPLATPQLRRLLAVTVAVVVETLVEYGVEQRSADKGLVELDTVPIGKDPATDGVSNDCRRQNGPNSGRRAPEAVAGPKEPPDHQADRDSVKDHGVSDARVLGHQSSAFQKRVDQQARKTGQEGEIVGVGRERAGDPFDEIRCAHPHKENHDREDPMVFPGMGQHLPEDDRRHGDVHDPVEEAHGDPSAMKPPVEESAHDRGGQRTGKLKHEESLHGTPVQRPEPRLGSISLESLGGAGSNNVTDIVILIDTVFRRVFQLKRDVPNAEIT